MEMEEVEMKEKCSEGVPPCRPTQKHNEEQEESSLGSTRRPAMKIMKEGEEEEEEVEKFDVVGVEQRRHQDGNRGNEKFRMRVSHLNY